MHKYSVHLTLKYLYGVGEETCIHLLGVDGYFERIQGMKGYVEYLLWVKYFAYEVDTVSQFYKHVS